MGNRSKSQKKEKRGSKRRAIDEDVASEDIDDEIDAFSRQKMFLRVKVDRVEDDMHNEEEDEDSTMMLMSGLKFCDSLFELQASSSDAEIPAEEEAEVLRLQMEKAKSLSMEDFGLQEISPDETTLEPTIGEIMVGGKGRFESAIHKGTGDDILTAFEEVKKDLNALSKEEQMDVVYRELVALLSELNDAVKELESRINPLLSKVKKRESTRKGGSRHLEVRQILLLAYCQAIAFYFLLKSEGQPVHDHPVIARLLEVKGLLEKVISGGDDLPRRDDIGERRRKHELQVLAVAGFKSEDDLGDEDGNLEAYGGADSEDSESEESADEFYKQVKQQRAATLATKAEMYSRDSILA
ncbi:hypothetical protein EUGRSUZ_H00313 [Eucalyptus grandis]|uniref:Uncharacterized protein n=1 Tax=Eucalyptus grandis TaxID=71139 RepID=A0ACC3JL85_EUCGR|nr:hypothetical protein EUGRSUZ_H00313 [Eucalyptus grandis]